MLEDCVRVVKESIRGLGGLDVIISNAVSFSLLSMELCLQWDTANCRK